MPSKAICFATYLLFAGSTGLSNAQNVPPSSHVWMITEENHSFEDVIGNNKMPYFNQLAQQYGLATQFYSDQHSSLPALMWFVAGGPVETDNDTTSCQHSQDNVVRELRSQGYSWRAYEEDLPYSGYQGLFSPDMLYYRRHNPLIDFTDACPGSGQETNSEPLAQMATDFSNDNSINYVYITPNVKDDAHNGTLQEADEWLQQNVPAILARPEFRTGGDGILFIVWDEAKGSDNRCSSDVSFGCGGRTATLVIGPNVTSGYQSSVTYHNENVLATVCAAMTLSNCPGAAQYVAPMADFFSGVTTTPPPGSGIVISSPTNGATIDGPVQLVATAVENKPIRQTEVWDNGVKLGIYGASISATFALAAGTHTTAVLDLDNNHNIIHRAKVNYTVQAPVIGVQIVSPTPNQDFATTTVQVVAQTVESVPVSQIQVWDNGKKLGWYSATTINQYYTLSPGTHTLTVLDLDSNYNVLNLSTVLYSVE